MPLGTSWRFEDREADGYDAANLNTVRGQAAFRVTSGLNFELRSSGPPGPTIVMREQGVSEDATVGAVTGTLTANATNYIYFNSSYALVVNTTGFPAYPSTKYYSMFEVDVNVSNVVTAIRDRRRFVA